LRLLTIPIPAAHWPEALPQKGTGVSGAMILIGYTVPEIRRLLAAMIVRPDHADQHV
jgi:hypothetical protein